MAKRNIWKEQFNARETKEEALIRMYEEGSKAGDSPKLAKLAELFGVSNNAVNKKLGTLRKQNRIGYFCGATRDVQSNQGQKKHGEEWHENSAKGFASLDIVSSDFLSIEQALKKVNVDEDVWEIVDIKRGCWTTPIAARVYEGHVITEEKLVKNYSIRITFRRKKPKPVEVACETLIQNIPEFKYSKVPPKFVRKTGVALEIAPVDAHFAKLSWDAETMRGDYDLSIATSNYLKVVEENLAWGSVFKPEKIFFIVGQDLMHSENYSGTTPSGHNILDVDTRLPKLIETALEISIKAVYRCRSVSKVEVIWIPGNHDPTSSLWLCHVIRQHFRNDKHVEVDVSPSTRKARLWGNLLVGWTHIITGRQYAWANELAQAFPRMWGNSKYREWHHGHLHKKNVIKTAPVLTQGGVVLRQLTALSPIDAWHFENMFTDAVPGSESFLWSKDKGIFSNFVAWL